MLLFFWSCIESTCLICLVSLLRWLQAPGSFSRWRGFLHLCHRFPYGWMGHRCGSNWLSESSFTSYWNGDCLCKPQSSRGIQNCKICQSFLWLERLHKVLQFGNILAVYPFHPTAVWAASSFGSDFWGRTWKRDRKAPSFGQSNQVRTFRLFLHLFFFDIRSFLILHQMYEYG